MCERKKEEEEEGGGEQLAFLRVLRIISLLEIGASRWEFFDPRRRNLMIHFHSLEGKIANLNASRWKRESLSQDTFTLAHFHKSNFVNNPSTESNEKCTCWPNLSYTAMKLCYSQVSIKTILPASGDKISLNLCWLRLVEMWGSHGYLEFTQQHWKLSTAEIPFAKFDRSSAEYKMRNCCLCSVWQ